MKYLSCRSIKKEGMQEGRGLKVVTTVQTLVRKKQKTKEKVVGE